MNLLNEQNRKKYTFSPEVMACINAVEDKFRSIEPNKYNEYEDFKLLCENLFQCAVLEKSDYLFALSYFYLMMYYASANNYKDAVSCALEGIKYQQMTEEYHLQARSYNVLAILTDTIGDHTRAVDYYLCCIDLCIEHQFHYVHSIASANLAELFHQNLNFDRALTYYNQAEEFLKKCMPDTDSLEHLGSFCYMLCNKGYCFLSVDMLDKAVECELKITELVRIMEQKGIYYDVFVINTFLATISYRKKDRNKMMRYLKIAQSDFHTADNYIHYLDDIEAYIDLYMNLEAYDDVLEIVNHFLEKCEKDNADFHIYSLFAERRIDCVTRMNDKESFVRYAMDFFVQYEGQNRANPEAVLHAEKMHKESVLFQKQKYEMLLLNEKLLAESRHDILTGLPNRAYLNQFAEETLANAVKNQVSFGVELLDIDYFKNINDDYGHLEGDRYLSTLAELLQKFASDNENVFTARYGGDEFVIIYYGKSDEEVLSVMAELKGKTNQIVLPHDSPLNIDCLSISQGAINLIPKNFNRIWDFLAHADRILYEVKKKSKNDYRLKSGF